MKIAIFLIGYPGFSEPWIINHIESLIDYGFDVDIYVNNERKSNKFNSEDSQYRLLSRTKFLKYKETNRLIKFIKGTLLFIGNIKKKPRPLCRSLNFFKYGRESFSFSFLYTAINYLDIPKYDIVHCHFGPSGVLASILKEFGLIKCPIITTFHGFDINVYPKKVKRNNYSILFKNGQEYTAVSNFALNKLLALGADPKKTYIWPMGVDLNKLHFVDRNFKTIVKSGEIIILTVARLESVKGLQFAIDAICLVKKSFPNIKYYIIGEGKERQDLEKLVSHNMLHKNVHFLGAIPHSKIYNYYKNSHVFLLPSIVDEEGAEEAFPVVLLEAQASGLPIIASNVGGIPEALNHGKSGILVRPKDPESIANALCDLLHHPQDMKTLSILGRERVEKNFSLKKLNNFMINKYKKLVNKPTL